MTLLERASCGCERYLVGAWPVLRPCPAHRPIQEVMRATDGE